MQLKIVLIDKTELMTEAELWSSSNPSIETYNDTREKFIQIGDFKINKESILYVEKIEEKDKEKE